MPFYKDNSGSVHFIDSGEFLHLLTADCTEITAAEAAALQRPDSATAKSIAWSSIKAERDRRTENGGVLVDGRWFDTDTKSALRYKILADFAAAKGLPETAVLRDGWRPMDVDVEGEVAMTYGLLLRIIAAGIALALDIDDAAQVHRAAMEASSDPSNYDFSDGWPQVFVK